jgi:cell division control protein 6
MTLFQIRESHIFKDARWLQPLSDLPSGKPLCREADLETMALFLSDVFTTSQARNLFIYGKPGTGKTVCVQYLLSEIRKHAEENHVPLIGVYVNAGKTRTPYYTMLEIVKALGLDVPDRGWQMFRLKQAFEDARKDKAIVVAIDEVDSIIFKEKEPLVYYLNRQPKTTLILVSNKIEDATGLPIRALSTLQLKLFRLEPYTPQEAKTILAERVEKALQRGAISDKLLDIIAEVASKAEDIRLGFSTLLYAGLLAEKAGKTKVDAEDIKSAIQSETRLEQIKDQDRKLKAIKEQLAAIRARLRS